MSDQHNSTHCYPLPLLGDQLPEFEALTTHGPMKFPDALKGSWCVLFSHPADFTPVCTTEFVAFQSRASDFAALDCKLVGLSIDQVFSHIKWLQWIDENLGVKISFPVIAGTESIATKLGMLHSGKGTNTVRTVFIIDPKGAVRLIMYYPQEIGRNIDEILRAVKALQVSENQGSTPANWPANELIGDRVIVGMPLDIRLIEEHMRKHECYDWWLCHKEYNKA